MFEFLAQTDYLRTLQYNFARSSSSGNMFEVFTVILAVVLPLVAAAFLWRYRRLVMFHCARQVALRLHKAWQQAVEEFLVDNAVLFEVYHLSSNEEEYLICHARVTSTADGVMVLLAAQGRPTTVDLKGKRVRCVAKPFELEGKTVNAFETYVHQVRKIGSTLKGLRLLTPAKYEFIIRRKHSREHLRGQDVIRVKAWDGRLRRNFWQQRPDFQTLAHTRNPEGKMQLMVEDISPGGLRLLIHNPRGSLPPLQPDDTLILRVSVRDPKSRKKAFLFFTVLGSIRGRFKGEKGAIGLGIQFIAVAEKRPGEGAGYSWKSLKGEVDALGELLEQFKAER